LTTRSIAKIDSCPRLSYPLDMAEPLPLDGITVLDLCDARGAFCGKLLADMGADVILVEPPQGSSMRATGPFHPDATPTPETSLFFWHFNTNKRSVTVDLASQADRRRFLELATSADIVVESAPANALPSQQFGYEALKALNPRLVLTSITPFGLSGPYRDFRASDLIAQALGGMAYVNGLEDAEPLQGFGLPAYHAAALWAAIASVLGLLARRQTGRGQWLDISVHACTAAVVEHSTSSYRAAGTVVRRSGPLHWTQSFRTGRCRDGYVVHGLMGDWTALSEWISADLGEHDLTEAAWTDPAYRQDNQARLFRMLDRWTADRPAESIAEAGQLRRLPYAVLQPLEALLSNPQLRARSYFFPIEYGDSQFLMQQPGAPYVVNGRPRRPPQRAPRLGEHNAVVFASIRATKTRIDAQAPHPLPLRGLRVLDFTWAVAGPLTTRILAEQGADVIKIEHPQAQRDLDSPDLATSLNRGKRSIAINMGEGRGIDLARRLVAASDVVVDNFSPRVMRNWGLTAEVLHDQHPRLISIGMSGFGATGPFQDRVSYGPTLHAVAGHSLMMRQRHFPVGWGFSYSDMVAGHTGALAILMAVWQRQHTGRGQRIDLSQFETLVAVSGVALLAMQSAALRPPGNDSQEAAAAPHGIYPCADDSGNDSSTDRWCAIAVFDDADWQRFAGALDSPSWTADPRFATQSARQLHRRELDTHVAQWTRQLRADQVMSRLQEAGVAAGIVADARDLCERDPQLRHRGYRTILHCDAGHGFEIDEPFAASIPAPGVGQHTETILTELLQCDATTLEALRRDGIVS
jgi:crotonobetainyl-CoA:carnitine CoA-transferase CaiB-like acyl-CoA transferase